MSANDTGSKRHSYSSAVSLGYITVHVYQVHVYQCAAVYYEALNAS